MKISQEKLRELMGRQVSPPSPDELRREENVFFVGGNLPPQQTIETLFDSHFQCNAALFHLTFGDIGSFQNGEMIARLIKKNFNARLMGRIDYAAPAHLIERAYAAGVDILDMPLPGFGAAAAGARGAGVEERLAALHEARSVFPRWSVVSTLVAGDEPAGSTVERIDLLLAAEVLPLVTLSGRGARPPAAEVAELFAHLGAGWRRKKAVVKPLLPLIYLTTPFVPVASRGMLRGFIDTMDDRRLLAVSDLRRNLRVKEVAESFESSGL